MSEIRNGRVEGAPGRRVRDGPVQASQLLPFFGGRVQERRRVVDGAERLQDVAFDCRGGRGEGRPPYMGIAARRVFPDWRLHARRRLDAERRVDLGVAVRELRRAVVGLVGQPLGELRRRELARHGGCVRVWCIKVAFFASWMLRKYEGSPSRPRYQPRASGAAAGAASTPPGALSQVRPGQDRSSGTAWRAEQSSLVRLTSASARFCARVMSGRCLPH